MKKKKKFCGNNTGQASMILLIWFQEVGKNKVNFHSNLTRWGEMKINGHYVDGYDPNKKCMFRFKLIQ